MKTSALAWIGGPLLLAACAAPAPTETPEGYILELPEAVIAIAAPYQDLNAVRVDPASGCYVYRHVGPVEITFLPLRTKDGRPICTQAAQVAQAPATEAEAG
ncbi:MAG TPA: hypothetical protein ENJ52_12155 [Aliiroseovarius sp.]|nr:hypothetical protein [Aliiroseovarius sp.]